MPVERQAVMASMEETVWQVILFWNLWSLQERPVSYTHLYLSGLIENPEVYKLLPEEYQKLMTKYYKMCIRDRRAVAKTLPVCSVRNLAYATFTVLNFQGKQVSLYQFDNPDAILIRRCV